MVVGLVKFSGRDLPNEMLKSRVRLADRPLKYSGLMEDKRATFLIGSIKVIILICLNQIVTRLRAVLVFSGIC
jgi:hypothetical protein